MPRNGSYQSSAGGQKGNRGRLPNKGSFPKGRSGNPKGRPRKRELTPHDALAAAWSGKVSLRDGTVQKSRFDYFFGVLLSNVSKGHASAGRALVDLYKLHMQYAPGPNYEEEDHVDYGAEVRRKLNEMAERRQAERDYQASREKETDKDRTGGAETPKEL